MTRFGRLNIFTGVIDNYFNLPYMFAEYNPADAEYSNGILYISYDLSRSGTTTGLVGYVASSGVPVFQSALPSTSLKFFSINTTNNTWDFWDGSTLSFTVAGLAAVQRISISDDGGITVSIDDGGSTISIDDGSGSITVDGTVTSTITVAPSVNESNVSITETATEIVASRAARRGLIIQNADTANTIWIGSSGMTTSSGVEMLPKQIVALNNYTGATASIYGICAAGKTGDCRYLAVY